MLPKILPYELSWSGLVRLTDNKLTKLTDNKLTDNNLTSKSPAKFCQQLSVLLC